MKVSQIGSAQRNQSRRHWLELGWKSAAAVLAVGGTRLSAATSTGGRVLVQLQLFGGNDSNNMIVPLNSSEYSRYSSVRGPLAVPQGNLLPIAAPRLNAQFGFHPSMTELHDLYQRKALAVVANTGEMSSPLNKSQVTPTGVPVAAQDHLTAALSYLKDGFTTPAWDSALLAIADRIALAKRVCTFEGGISMLSATPTAADGTRNYATLVRAMASTTLRTVFPDSGLGQELKAVAQLINAASKVGATTPVITCSQSGYDTHVNQLAYQPALFRDLSASLGAFANAMDEIGAASRVTLYTQTEFNRTLMVNKTGGTEHGWGGHQLVMGHSVLGGDVYGTFPGMALGGVDDAVGNGTWIPSSSNDQYNVTLARWLGAGAQNLSTAFPSLTRFPVQDLGFVV
jgi:uncharacterized protein (DUF1501 family)